MLSYLSLFYFLFSSNSELNVIHQSSFPLDVASFKTRMNICGKTTIYMFLGMLPIIAAAVLFRKNDAFRKYKAILGWSVLGSVIGVGVWSLVFHKVDSVQLWSNFYYPTVGVLSVVCLYYLLMERKWIHVVFLLLFVCADLFMFTPDINLIRKPQKPSEKYAFLAGKRVALFNYYDPKMNVYSRNEAVSFGSFSELMSFTNAKLISFSTVEIHSQDAVFEQIVRQSHLYQLKPFPLDKSEEEYVVYQDTMLSKLKIDYIVVNKKRTNPLVMKKLKLELIPLEDVNYRIYKIIH